MSLLGEPCKLLERENSLAFRRNDQSNLEPFTTSDRDVYPRQVMHPVQQSCPVIRHATNIYHGRYRSSETGTKYYRDVVFVLRIKR